MTQPCTVTVAGTAIAAAVSVATLADAPADAYVWDEGSAEVRVKVFDRSEDLTITVLSPSSTGPSTDWRSSQ